MEGLLGSKSFQAWMPRSEHERGRGFFMVKSLTDLYAKMGARQWESSFKVIALPGLLVSGQVTWWVAAGLLMAPGSMDPIPSLHGLPAQCRSLYSVQPAQYHNLHPPPVAGWQVVTGATILMVVGHLTVEGCHFGLSPGPAL